jgi:hypothetical protein
MPLNKEDTDKLMAVLNSPEFLEVLHAPLDEEMSLRFQIASLQERLSQVGMKKCRCVIGGPQTEPCPVHPYFFR